MHQPELLPRLYAAGRVQALAWVLIAVSAQAWSQDAPSDAGNRDITQIRECARNNLPEQSFSQRIELTSWDAGGSQRTLAGALYGVIPDAERLSMMLSVDVPMDLAGARYLLNRKANRDDMYVYLPALSRTRRIVGGMKGQPLWGTDFSYEDIKHLQVSLNAVDTELVGHGLVEGRPAHTLRVIPLAEAESAYTTIEVDIDQQTCLLLQARFFDSSGVFKQMSTDPQAYQQMDARWVPGIVNMENLRSQTRSELKLGNYVFDERISRNRFNPKSFHLAN